MTVRVRPCDLYVYDGQSLMLQPIPGITIPERVELAVGSGRHLNRARGGTAYSERDDDVARRVDAEVNSVTGTRYFIDAGGTLEVFLGGGAAFIAQMEAYWNARKAAGFNYIVASTIPDSTTFDAGMNDNRLALNQAIRDSLVPDAVADVAAIAVLGDADASANTTYFSDGTHYTNAATLLAGPLFVAALP